LLVNRGVSANEMGLSPPGGLQKSTGTKTRNIMPEFNYIARNGSGERVTGQVSANSRREALAALGQQALFPVSVEGGSTAAVGKSVRRVPAQLMATTFGQLSDLLRSGVPLLRSLEVLRGQTSHAGLADVLGQVGHLVEEGATLAEAMAGHERVFGEMAINMVRAGGEGGFMEEALSRVADFTEAQEDLKKRTLGAVTYPAFLAVVGFVVVVVLVVFFVPQFEEMFARLRDRGELPVMTDWLLATSDLLRRFGVWMVAAAIVGGWFARRWLITDEGRLWRDQMKIRLPVAGKIFLSLAVARFCRVLGTLLRNGVPILRSLEISASATGNRVLAIAINAATENVSAGESLARPLAACGRFPPAVVEMIAVAEESASLESVLLDIADSLERRTWRQLDLAVRMLEPIMLLVLATVVLMVVVALLLPVLKMSAVM